MSDLFIEVPYFLNEVQLTTQGMGKSTHILEMNQKCNPNMRDRGEDSPRKMASGALRVAPIDALVRNGEWLWAVVELDGGDRWGMWWRMRWW